MNKEGRWEIKKVLFLLFHTDGVWTLKSGTLCSEENFLAGVDNDI